MREMEQRALSYLGRKPILCMDMLEALRRGDGAVSAVRADGVLIYVRRSGAYMLAAGNLEAADALGLLAKGAAQLAVHDRKNAEMLRDKLGYGAMMECRAAAFIEVEPPLPMGFDLREIKPLGPEQEDAVMESFPEEFDRQEIRERLSAGAVHGIIRRRELLGMAGLYPEGGIGMMAVRGDIEEQEAVDMLGGLAAYMTGWCLENCLAPFAHLPVEDELTLSIYEQLGYTVADKSMFWLG